MKEAISSARGFMLFIVCVCTIALENYPSTAISDLASGKCGLSPKTEEGFWALFHHWKK